MWNCGCCEMNLEIEVIGTSIAQKTTTRVAESLSPLSTTRGGFARLLAVANPSCLSQQPAFPTAFHSCEIQQMHGPCQMAFALARQRPNGSNRLQFKAGIIFENSTSPSILDSLGRILLCATAPFARALCNRSYTGSPLSPDHCTEMFSTFQKPPACSATVMATVIVLGPGGTFGGLG